MAAYPKNRREAVGRVYVKDLVDQVFGRLIVKWRGPNAGKHAQWFCLCKCGAWCLVAGHNLVTESDGKVRSCGCLRRERAKTAMERHMKSTKELR